MLMVTRLDRLARSTRDLLNTLAAIAGKGAGFRSLGDTWADTTTAHGRLMLTVLAGLAEFERELIRARTGEGRERAKAQGVKMGRKPKLTLHQIGPMTAKLCVLATGPRCLIPAFGRLAGCRFGRGGGPLLTFRRFALPQEYRGRHAVPGAGALFCKSSDPSLTFRGDDIERAENHAKRTE